MTKRRAISARTRFRVLARCGFRCAYCGATSAQSQLEIDHVIPVAKGGTDDEANLVAACFYCNRGKSDAAVSPTSDGFVGWLRLQRYRDDWIGDLADDEERAPLPDVQSYRELARALRADSAALHAAWHAWREWRRGGNPTRATRAQQAETRRAIRACRDEGSCVWLKRGAWMAGVFYPYEAAA